MGGFWIFETKERRMSTATQAEVSEAFEIDPEIQRIANQVRKLCKGRADRFSWVKTHLSHLRKAKLDELSRSELEDVKRRLETFLP